MRYVPSHKPLTRRRIVEAAGIGFRDRGLAGIGVAEVMQRAGLTHGGFYAHFRDKDALVIAACLSVLGEARNGLQGLIDRNPSTAAAALVRRYLAPANRARRAPGCAIVALGSELARAAPAVRTAVAGELEAFVASLSTVMPGRSAAARREAALRLFASLIGSLLLSRLLPEGEGLRLLSAARRTLAAPSRPLGPTLTATRKRQAAASRKTRPVQAS